jgi:pimeloyl-ACP methyl ester carboxylesterase/class 3 adenylate cyclase
MEESGEQRQLLAIMFTDVVGYAALTERDEAAAVKVRDHHRSLVGTLVEQFDGQLIDATGDESLSIFPSALRAVDCALALQGALRSHPEFRLRIGIHLGDVIHRGGEVIGEGVNIAARIRPLAEPGGIAVSEPVYQLVRSRAHVIGNPLGPQALKNVGEPVQVFTLFTEEHSHPIPQRSSRRRVWVACLVGAISIAAILIAVNRAPLMAWVALNAPRWIGTPVEQEVGFTETSDGVRIAYATSGSGPPVVFVVGWGTHLKEGIGSPLYDRAGFIRRLSARNTLVRYDGRGFGLSDRDVEDFSLEARVRDLEAVADALSLPRFAILGMSAGGPTAIAYAYEHPERVSKLLLGSSTVGPAASPEATPFSEEEFLGMMDLSRTSWSSPRVRMMWVETLAPQADEVGRRVLSEFMRVCCDGATLAGFFMEYALLDTSEMARQLRVPTLVIHGDEDQTVPMEHGRVLASLIPGSRLEILEGAAHGLPGVPHFVDRVVDFLAEPTPASGAPGP